VSFDYSKLNDQPSPFYRVSVKAFIFDDQQRLLMGKGEGDTWEPPGGGLEHDEAIIECLRRELLEELGVELDSAGEVICFYRGTNSRGFQALKVALKVTLKNFDFKPGDLKETKFVNKVELLALPMSTDEVGIKECVDKIWSD
jgi:8-oxo-dGTP pyrophosphatase MutT (NUDIX family)